MLYTDFIRKKMHNLSKIITASGYPLKIISKFNRKAVDYVIHGKTENGSGVGNKTLNVLSVPYEDIGSATEIIRNGISYKIGADGSITMNGTVTGNQSQLFLKQPWATTYTLPSGKYTVSWFADGSEETYYFQVVGLKNRSEVSQTRVRCFNEPVILDLTDADYDAVGVKIYVNSGVTLNNLTVYPMINEGETAAPFEPYSEYDYKIPIKNTHGDTSDTLEIYINSQLKDGESISFKSDGLSELKLHKGENNITVETDIKPSEVDVKYYN